MSEQLAGRSDMSSLDSLTLALVVSGLGFYTDETAAGLRRNVESKGIVHTAKEFDASLERATRHFAQGDSHLFLCDGEPCRQRRRFDSTPMCYYVMQNASAVGFPHGLPRALQTSARSLLRIGHGCEFFAQFVGDLGS
jgi:hypothetical protein